MVDSAADGSIDPGAAADAVAKIDDAINQPPPL
jgi:hypothetical protein